VDSDDEVAEVLYLRPGLRPMRAELRVGVPPIVKSGW
jgi:hypothetical protein